MANSRGQSDAINPAAQRVNSQIGLINDRPDEYVSAGTNSNKQAKIHNDIIDPGKQASIS